MLCYYIQQIQIISLYSIQFISSQHFIIKIMSLSSKVLTPKFTKPSSQSRILLANNSKINHTLTNSQLMSGSKISFARKIEHAKSNSTLSMSRGIPVQSFVREREVDKFSLAEDYYEFVCLKVSDLVKGFRMFLSVNGKDVSKIRIDFDSIEIEKNQIRHTFDIPRNREARYVKIILSSLTNNKLSIDIESILAKFKASEILINKISQQFIELNPYKLIEEAEEIRKRKFTQSSSKSVVKERASLKIGQSRKLLFNNLKPFSESNKAQTLSTSQIVCFEKQTSNTNIQKTNVQKTQQQQKLRQTLELKKQLENKLQKFKKPQHTISKGATTKTWLKTQLNISTTSIAQPTIYEYSSVKNISKPNNQHLFKRKVKPTTYSQLALSKMTSTTSRIQ